MRRGSIALGTTGAAALLLRSVDPLFQAIATASSTSGARSLASGSPVRELAVALSPAVPTYLVWGANTDVGKTVVSYGLAAAASRAKVRVCYVKPVQTGFPGDSDARKVAAGGMVADMVGVHARQISDTAHEPYSQPCDDPVTDMVATTLHAWRQPVSPHLAVQREGRAVSDVDIRRATVQELNKFCGQTSAQARAGLALIETAGGPASPSPSGRLQPLHISGLLIGDGRLGGISTTISAYESLQARGCPPVAIAVIRGQEAAASGNADALQLHFGPAVPVISLPHCQAPVSDSPSDQVAGIDQQLHDWTEASRGSMDELLHLLRAKHEAKFKRMNSLANKTLQHIWYPFTQHQGMNRQHVTTIVARAGECFAVLEGEGSDQRLAFKHDACSSWWTQGVSEQLQPRLVRALGEAAGRYGHVMHPETAYEPAVGLAERLLSGPGQGWADRVFYSDDGSTAVEVGLKMAMRKFRADNGNLQPCELQVVGNSNGYHGDTLGAMDAVAPSPFNGPEHMPWYKGRGLFLEPPTVGLVKGEWRIIPPEMHGPEVVQDSWQELAGVFSPARHTSKAGQAYEAWIEAQMDKHEHAAGQAGGQPVRLAVCLLEPVLQGAGGMHFIDPAFQCAIIRACRKRKMPVLFDEVFTGLWRIGAISAARLLGMQPDVACYAKLLTGGMLPLSATLATSAVFDAFSGDTKLQALLHGHSYAGNAIGCAVACEAYDIFSSPALNSNVHALPQLINQQVSDSAACQQDVRSTQNDDLQMRCLWDAELVKELSWHERVTRVVALGCVLAAELAAADGGGYASGEAKAVVQKLRGVGVFARPLGNVVYLMVTPTTSPEVCTSLLQRLMSALKQ